MRRFAWILLLLPAAGCSLIPEPGRPPQFFNPYPQLKQVAVLPFYNQSNEPTVDGEALALAYHNELQRIQGFKVMPPGVARIQLAASGIEPHSAVDFQRLAQLMGVDVVVVGSVTDYSPYYPPRLGLLVNWYAANPCFHPIPPGYGLPWGTGEEEFIPAELRQQAEFALADAQLAAQTPEIPQPDWPAPPGLPAESAVPLSTVGHDAAGGPLLLDAGPFIPAQPTADPPACEPYYGPIISMVRQYNGADEELTAALANYYYFRDDARFGGYQSYLQRSDDFTRFCCHLHITEMLSARGGSGESPVVYRVPLRRYLR